MKKLIFYLVSILFTCILVSKNIFSQEKSGGKVSGYVFGDFFYKISGNSTEISPSQYSSFDKDFQAFQIRRGYLYYDHNINENFTVQFLLEGNDKIIEAKTRYTLIIKTAYLEWKNVLPLGSIAFGLVPTPTWAWGVSEKMWNYRSIEKPAIDFRGMGDASDFGVTIRGKFDNEGILNYVAMIGNGNGQKNENNKYKKYYLDLNARIEKSFVAEGYFDYEPWGGDKSKTSYFGLLSYNTPEFTIGLQAIQQQQKQLGSGNTDLTKFVTSAFVWGKLMDGFNAFARYDFSNPNTKVSDKGYNEAFYVLGLDYMPIKDVHIMPNLWINTFSDKSTAGLKKDADVVGRITFFYVYK